MMQTAEILALILLKSMEIMLLAFLGILLEIQVNLTNCCLFCLHGAYKFKAEYFLKK